MASHELLLWILDAAVGLSGASVDRSLARRREPNGPGPGRLAVAAVRRVHDDEEVSHPGGTTDDRRHPAACSGCVSDDRAETCSDDCVDRPGKHERTCEYVCNGWRANPMA
jgi:hypothetical protein